MRISEAEWVIAVEVCTPAQLQALDYWRHGYGYKRIAVVLQVSSSTARGRVDRALDNVRRASVQSAVAMPRS